MIRISDKARQELKKPLGRLVTDSSELAQIVNDHKIVSVGDICTLTLLDLGIMPHLAVYDYRYMRRDLEQEKIAKLEGIYPSPKTFLNPAGELSEEILQEAANLLAEGGAILIKGEDDLTALAFISAASADYLILYGQPDEGIVVVRPDRETKEKIRKIIGSTPYL
jgi:uncharacterized protein (UPF0218 family)